MNNLHLDSQPKTSENLIIQAVTKDLRIIEVLPKDIDSLK